MIKCLILTFKCRWFSSLMHLHKPVEDILESKPLHSLNRHINTIKTFVLTLHDHISRIYPEIFLTLS